MNNSVRIEYAVNGKVEAFWLSVGTLDEIDDLRKKLEDIILNSQLWKVECPMKGKGCQCSAREKCIHYKKEE